MKYISENDLKKQFWKGYGYRKGIIAYQFECQSRHGAVDLLTVERVPDDKGFHIEIVGFEFKLNDIDKAFAQAAYNCEFCHKDALRLHIRMMVVNGTCFINAVLFQMKSCR